MFTFFKLCFSTISYVSFAGNIRSEVIPISVAGFYVKHINGMVCYLFSACLLV
jgi:hypothetical protein